jgi:hypothetical protein
LTIGLRSWQETPDSQQGVITALAFAGDGNELISVGTNGTVRVWAVKPEGIEAGRKFTVGDGQIRSRGLCTSGDTIAIGSFDGAIRFWDRRSSGSRGSLPGHSAAVYSVALSSTGDRLVSASKDTTVRIWQTAAEKEELQIDSHDGPVYAVELNATCDLLASGGSDAKICLSSFPEGELMDTLAASAPVFDVGFLTGDRIVAACGDGKLRVWTPPGLSLSATIELGADDERGAKSDFAVLSRHPYVAVCRDATVVLRSLDREGGVTDKTLADLVLSSEREAPSPDASAAETDGAGDGKGISWWVIGGLVVAGVSIVSAIMAKLSKGSGGGASTSSSRSSGGGNYTYTYTYTRTYHYWRPD